MASDSTIVFSRDSDQHHIEGEIQPVCFLEVTSKGNLYLENDQARTMLELLCQDFLKEIQFLMHSGSFVMGHHMLLCPGVNAFFISK